MRELFRKKAEESLSLGSWRPPRQLYLGLTLVVGTVSLVISAPLVGWPPTLRLSAVLSIAALLGTLIAQPWTWSKDTWQRVATYEPSRLALFSGAFAAAALLFWSVVTLFEGGYINAVDFTVYFDRPLYQTIHGRPLFVETTDDPFFEYRSHLGVHAYWLLLPLSMLYKVHATPVWLLALSVLAVVAGSVRVVRIGQVLGFPGVLSCAAALAFVLNDNTARALRYGFHPEVLYAWFVPWLMDAGLRGAKRSYFAATVACVLVKEDAILPLAGAAMVLAVMRGRGMTSGDRIFFLAMPLAMATANLTMFYMYVVPALSPNGEVAYANFWTNYGSTPTQALAAMLQQPQRVAGDVAMSGLFGVVVARFAFLPVLGWRWFVGVLPVALIFGTSANEQVRDYGIYYAIYLVPFLTIAAADGARTMCGRLATPARAGAAAAAVLAISSMATGPGYALRSWRAEVAAVGQAIEALGDERAVLVQGGLYPHAGYGSAVQLLTPAAMHDPANRDAVILIAAAPISTYPLTRDQITSLLQQSPTAHLPGSLVAIRNPMYRAVGDTRNTCDGAESTVPAGEC